MARSPIVIKYGGNAMTDPTLRKRMAQAIGQVPAAVVVHGGGPFIAEALAEAGLESRVIRGLRVTTPQSVATIERTLTLLGKQLAQEVGRGVGLTGRDAGLLHAETFDEALGRVGRMVSVRSELLVALLERAFVPVIACLATDAAGGALNVNADEVAGAVAAALGAPVVFLSNVPGVLDDPERPESVLGRLTRAEIHARIRDGRISGGMIPKVEAALAALEAGAVFAVIADGREPEQLAAVVAGQRGTRVVN